MDSPNFCLLKNRCHDDWQAYTQHRFLRELADGSLPKAAFQHYLQQDYLFLIHFARAYALAAYKSRTLADLRQAHEGLKAILDLELGLHVEYCAGWGISEAALEQTPEARPTTAYTRYVLDTGQRGDLLDLHVALAPCVIGYAEIADWINAQSFTVRGAANPYDAWIGMYESDEFQAAAQSERDWINARMERLPAPRIAQIAQIFREATRLETDFWAMNFEESAYS
ncbi:transcriptional regulator [Spiribacter salinus M19-40]|uniref:Aminopyrimidine aminohydrolase n=1 Tax=Spiribacter salinus M19-40 TaxID=1260251 RepID=R4V574_9GAMM|nr:thiaminase II [Spiribacter salinus]AGM40205.1 transcriptional regulator [Spiribacter salinus M19-40]MBY5268564.1 thiaminase II [Spiribacter salinus]